MKFKWQHRSRDAYMGRFGGGWQWKIGVQWCDTCMIVSFLVADLRITW